jgi:hypothetical protein
METIEIVIYLFIAIVIGGFVIAFIAGVEPKQMYDALRHLTNPGDATLEFKKLSSDRFASEAYKVWEACNYGTQERNLTVYIERGTPVDRAYIFATFKKLNLCYSIQSGNESCGTREDVAIASGSITPPALVTIRCDPVSRQLLLTA